MVVSLTASDVMRTPVETVSSAATVREVAGRLFDADIDSLVVADDDEPIGIVTESDLVELLADGSDVDRMTVAEFTSAAPTTVTSDADIHDVATRLRDGETEHVPVTDDGALVGIVTVDELSYYLPHLARHERSPDHVPETRYRVRPETAFEDPEWEFECRCVSRGQVTVGDVAEFSKTITEADVHSFAAISGDTNRLHLDEEYASGTRFGRRIVHGTLASGLISAALARLPRVTVYLSQDTSFQAPIDIGDRVTAVCEVVESLGGGKYRLTTTVHTDDGTTVMDGDATVLMDDVPETARIDVEEIDD